METQSQPLPPLAAQNATDAAPDSETLDALKAAQGALAMLISPATVTATSVAHAWAQAVAAEVKVRVAIEKIGGAA